MCGRTVQSTNLPEPSGPTDDRFVYHLTDAGRLALKESRRKTGAPTHPGTTRGSAVTAELSPASRRRRRAARAKKARQNGRRFGTVCGRWRKHRRVPDLRLSGDWLRQAGFELGQEFEVEVVAGRLTIQAL